MSFVFVADFNFHCCIWSDLTPPELASLTKQTNYNSNTQVNVPTILFLFLMWHLLTSTRCCVLDDETPGRWRETNFPGTLKAHKPNEQTSHRLRQRDLRREHSGHLYPWPVAVKSSSISKRYSRAITTQSNMQSLLSLEVMCSGLMMMINYLKKIVSH